MVKVAVLGSASRREDSPEGLLARRVGELVASAGAVLLTGGCMGLPHAAVAGARSLGGLTIAVSPAENRNDHEVRFCYPNDGDITIFTGMGTKGRNVVLVRSSDACVFIGGGMGTLNEFTIAFDDLDETRAIGVLTGTGGFSDELMGLAAMVERRTRALLTTDQDPAALMARIFDHVNRH
ncbi:MAG: LOG family protein [Pseudomonadota bacterium]